MHQIVNYVHSKDNREYLGALGLGKGGAKLNWSAPSPLKTRESKASSHLNENWCKHCFLGNCCKGKNEMVKFAQKML